MKCDIHSFRENITSGLLNVKINWLKKRQISVRKTVSMDSNSQSCPYSHKSGKQCPVRNCLFFFYYFYIIIIVHYKSSLGNILLKYYLLSSVRIKFCVALLISMTHWMWLQL